MKGIIFAELSSLCSRVIEALIRILAVLFMCSFSGSYRCHLHIHHTAFPSSANHTTGLILDKSTLQLGITLPLEVIQMP